MSATNLLLPLNLHLFTSLHHVISCQPRPHSKVTIKVKSWICIYRVVVKHHLWCATVSRKSALISASQPDSQASANTARPRDTGWCITRYACLRLIVVPIPQLVTTSSLKITDCCFWCATLMLSASAVLSYLPVDVTVNSSFHNQQFHRRP